MQVTHVEASVTHAIIGGQEAMEYTVDDSAEFFDIIFKALYSDPILASVRETLCNAWDAHIDAGRTDQAIEISLDRDGELIIRDHGKGIPKDKVKDIYLTAGKSTKKHDGKQTGGFGLGCKSPYAYTEHMEVTIWCEGMMTIYRGTKSNAEIGGKPSFIPIVSVPAVGQTGVQVKWQIQQKDRQQFDAYIRQVVQNGEMKAVYNGRELDVHPFSQAPNGWMILKERPINKISNIFVRYGNVIYPVDIHPEFADLYNQCQQSLKKLGPSWGGHNQWSLVLQAPGHSVAITPSRESINLTELTITTLKSLMNQFLTNQRKEVIAHVDTLLYEGIVDTWTRFRPHKLATPEKTLLGFHVDHRRADPSYVRDFKEFATTYAGYNYPDYKGFWRKDLITRARTLLESGYGGPRNRGKLQTFLYDLVHEEEISKRMPRVVSWDRTKPTWFQRRIVSPLVSRMAQEPLLDRKRLLVYSKSLKENDRWGPGGWEEAVKWSPKSMELALPFVRNFVILSYSRMDINERAAQFPAMQNWFGGPLESLVYVVPRSEERVKAARAFFLKQGLYLIDLTQRQAWEEPPAVRSRPPPKPKRLKTGLPSLDNVRIAGGVASARFRNMPVDEVVSIETPEFLVKLPHRESRNHIDSRLGDYASRLFVELFGKRGGCVVSDSQAAKWVKAEIPMWDTWIWKQFADAWTNNPRLKAYCAYDPRVMKELGLNDHQKQILDLVMNDPVLTNHLGIKDERTDDEKKLSDLYWNMVGNYRYMNHIEIGKITKLMNEAATNPIIETLVGMIKDSALIGIININGVTRVMHHKDSTAQQKQSARDLLIKAIEG